MLHYNFDPLIANVIIIAGRVIVFKYYNWNSTTEIIIIINTTYIQPEVKIWLHIC
jgi:hypothetical protein